MLYVTVPLFVSPVGETLKVEVAAFEELELELEDELPEVLEDVDVVEQPARSVAATALTPSPKNPRLEI